MVRLFAVAIVCCSVGAFADAVDITVTAGAVLGKSQPSVNVHILEPILGFKLNLKRSDGKEIEIKGGGKVNQTRVLELNQPEGKFTYVGTLTVNLPKGETSEMALQFDTSLYGPLRLKCEKEDLDVEHRKLRFTINRPADKAVLKVLMDTGKYAFNGEVPFNGADANKPLEVTWPEAKGKVMKVSLVVYDTQTFFTGVDFSPWQIDVEHKEVNFDSGKWDVGSAEADKLEESYVKISDQVTKYGQFAEIKLYVLGHTDTVGKNDANRSLSLNRARAIGSYLRKRGLRIPIFYDGLGEEMLLVGTADETDEAKNRRADYILSEGAPTVTGKGSFAPRWQKL